MPNFLDTVFAKVRKLRIVTNQQMEQLGRQTVLYRFWPFFRIIAPAMIGYFALGSILESTTDLLPYKVYVGSGLMIWFNSAAAILVSLRMAGNSERRRALISLSSSPQLVAYSYLSPYLLISFFFYAPVFQFKLDQGGYREAICLTLITLLILYVSASIHVFLALTLCVLATLIRDLRFILPYFAQLLLFASPIFYSPRTPNTFLEEAWTRINLLSYLLMEYRKLIDNPFLEISSVMFLIAAFLISILLNRIVSRIVFVSFLSMNKSERLEIEEE